MSEFKFKVEDVFNIVGRGTVLAGTYEGKIKSGVYLETITGEQIFCRGIEVASLTNKMGMCVRYDFEESKKLIGTTLKIKE
ncbi:hypothetical protein D3C87_79010 [compost metagenome]